MNIKDKTWNPWHGCHKCSEGCQNCFVYVLDQRYGRDTNKVLKNESSFKAPLAKDKNGNYKIKSGDFVRVCMTSDFFLEEADEWRCEAWKIIRQRPDVTFSLLTKRAERIKANLPEDWGDGWDNVQIAVSTENQKRADERIPYLLDVPCKSRWISVKPFIGEINLEKYLATGKIYTVLAGGENYRGSRPLYYEWIKSLHEQCVRTNVPLIFAQTGNIFIKDGKEYKIYNLKDQNKQAILANLSYPERNKEEIIKAIKEIDEISKKINVNLEV